MIERLKFTHDAYFGVLYDDNCTNSWGDYIDLVESHKYITYLTTNQVKCVRLKTY